MKPAFNTPLLGKGELFPVRKQNFLFKVRFGNIKTPGNICQFIKAQESGEEKNFFEALTKLGIETKTKDLQIFHTGTKKGDWDVGLTVDAIKMAPRLDSVVIISGDGDFIPLVEYLQTMGVQVEVVSFSQSTSSNLRDVVDDFVDLSANPKKYLIGMR